MAISKNENDERKCEYCGYDETNIDGSHEEYAMHGWETGGNIRRCRYLDSVYNITFNDNGELMRYEKNIYGECSDCGWKCEYPQSRRSSKAGKRSSDRSRSHRSRSRTS